MKRGGPYFCGAPGEPGRDVSATSWVIPWKVPRTGVCAVGVATNGSSHTITGVDVFGTALTNRVNSGAGAATWGSLWSADLATLSGNITITASVSVGRWIVFIWVFPASSAVPAATAVDTSAPISQSIALSKDGMLIALSLGVNNDVARPNWSNLPRRIRPRNVRIGSNLQASAFGYKPLVGETRLFSNEWDLGSSPRQGFFMSFAP